MQRVTQHRQPPPPLPPPRCVLSRQSRELASSLSCSDATALDERPAQRRRQPPPDRGDPATRPNSACSYLTRSANAALAGTAEALWSDDEEDDYSAAHHAAPPRTARPASAGPAAAAPPAALAKTAALLGAENESLLGELLLLCARLNTGIPNTAVLNAGGGGAGAGGGGGRVTTSSTGGAARASPVCPVLDSRSVKEMARMLRDGDLRDYHAAAAAAAGGGGSRGLQQAGWERCGHVGTIAMLRAHPQHQALFARCVKRLRAARGAAASGAAADAAPDAPSPAPRRDFLAENAAVAAHLTAAAVEARRAEERREGALRAEWVLERRDDGYVERQLDFEGRAARTSARAEHLAEQQRRRRTAPAGGCGGGGGGGLSRAERRARQARWAAAVQAALAFEGLRRALRAHAGARERERRERAAGVLQRLLFRGVFARRRFAGVRSLCTALQRLGAVLMITRWRLRRRVGKVAAVAAGLRTIQRSAAIQVRAALRKFFDRVLRVQRFMAEQRKRRYFLMGVIALQWDKVEEALGRRVRHEEADKLKVALQGASHLTGAQRQQQQQAQRAAKPASAQQEMLANMSREALRTRHLHCPAAYKRKKTFELLLVQRREHQARLHAYAARLAEHQQRVEDYHFALSVCSSPAGVTSLEGPTVFAEPLPHLSCGVGAEVLEPIIRRGWRVAERERDEVQLRRMQRELLPMTPKTPPPQVAAASRGVSPSSCRSSRASPSSRRQNTRVRRR